MLGVSRSELPNLQARGGGRSSDEERSDAERGRSLPARRPELPNLESLAELQISVTLLRRDRISTALEIRSPPAPAVADEGDEGGRDEADHDDDDDR